MRTKMKTFRYFVVLTLFCCLGACTKEEMLTPPVSGRVTTLAAATSTPPAAFPPTITPAPTPSTTPTPTPPVVIGPITYYGYLISDIPTLDPQVAEDLDSRTMVENLFMQLTAYDPVTQKIAPEMATAWEISGDVMVYTFTLRTDIPWVYHNPVTGETVQVTDEAGQPRFVTATDFVYGIKRNCLPETASYYGEAVIVPLVVGCAAAFQQPTVDHALYQAIGVQAPAPDTLVISLTRPAADFLVVTAMGYLSAVPEWTIEQFEEDWVEAGIIVTNGRFLLEQWIHNTQITLLRNPLFPPDLRGQGNIERVALTIVPDADTGYALWENNQVDQSALTYRAENDHLANYPNETVLVADGAIFYIGIRITKPPFDDVRVRRAFSAAFDREGYIAEMRNGSGLPMIHLLPPGLVGAAALDIPGVDFDPVYAREQLAAAGYPNCEGFPTITLLGYSGQTTLHWLEFAQQSWQEHLDCSEKQIVILQLPILCNEPCFPWQMFSDDDYFLDEELPHLWTEGWHNNYPDAHDGFTTIIWCEIKPILKRGCSEVDDLIGAAQKETDPTQRAALYWQIEELLFGREGEFPLIPIFLRAGYIAQHTWLTTPPLSGEPHQWYDWLIDPEQQAAARGT